MSNSNSKTVPAPFSFAASQYFEGPDGQWSSFVVRAGTPEQTFRVLPSTITSETLLPMAGACKQGAPANCPSLRGAEMYNGKPNDGFQTQNSSTAGGSSTWSDIGIYQVPAREELGYNASGRYGLDTLGLMIANSGGPTLKSQVIGAVTNPKLWVGRLGMDVKPSNFSGFENPQRSLIQTLKDEKYIPSLSYGYTAGAYYKQPSAYASLVYGGYDQTRFIPNNITFPFDANDSRKPSLNIQAIVSQNITNTTVSLLPDGAMYALIDFAEPQMWLPVSACDAFAMAFNLTYDNSTNLYLVDPATRARLLQQNPTITFGLGTTVNPAERVNIQLPYRAFDQQATYPIYPNATNYFPIRRATNVTQYTIGRTFFQEAYVRIDYERGNFSVHQALFPQTNDKQNIVPVLSPEYSGAAMKVAKHNTEALSRSVIAGISVSLAIMTVLLFCVCFWMTRRRNARKLREAVTAANEKPNMELPDQPKLETDGAAYYETDGRPFAEMDAQVFHEMISPEYEPGELDGTHTSMDLSTILELYEMDDTEITSPKRPYGFVSTRNGPPPGWI